MAGKRKPQLAAPIDLRLHKLFAATVSNNFSESGKPYDVAKFLRKIACETIMAYNKLPRQEVLELGLAEEAYGGPRLFRKVLSDWKNSHPELAAELFVEKQDDSEGQRGKVKR